MPMIKTLPTVNVAAIASQAAVELGATPFQIGGNCTLELDAPMAGAIVLSSEGAALAAGPWTAIRTINAAQSATKVFELTDLPKYFRTNVTTGGTAQTLNPILRGVQ